ncbi:MAG: hypothetical protein UHD05_07970, partial [Ruminococcus sp.]|nr:hypothetical protein [Ruminococcus sp.]
RRGDAGGDISGVMRGLMRGRLNYAHEEKSYDAWVRLLPILPDGTESPYSTAVSLKMRDYVDLLCVRGWYKIEPGIGITWGYNGVRTPSVVPIRQFRENYDDVYMELLGSNSFAEGVTYDFSRNGMVTSQFICNPGDYTRPPFATFIIGAGSYAFAGSTFKAYDVPCDIHTVEVLWGYNEHIGRALSWLFRLVSVDFETAQDVRSETDYYEGGDRTLRQRRSTQVRLTLQTIDDYTAEELAYFAPIFCGADVWVCAADIDGLGIDLAVCNQTYCYNVDNRAVRASVNTKSMSVGTGTTGRSRLTFAVDIYKYNNL